MEIVLHVLLVTVFGFCGMWFVSCSITFKGITESSLATPYVTEAGHNVITCSRKCSRDVTCKAAAFDAATSTCKLGNTSVYDNTTTVVVPQAGSVVYHPGCADGWVPYKGMCYMYVGYLNATWHDAQSHCRNQLGGELAHVVDFTHLALLNSLVTCVRYEMYCYPWVGYNDISVEGTVVGANLVPMSPELLASTFSNTDLNDCAYTDPDFNDELYLYDCSDLCVFFCERKM